MRARSKHPRILYALSLFLTWAAHPLMGQSKPSAFEMRFVGTITAIAFIALMIFLGSSRNKRLRRKRERSIMNDKKLREGGG